MTKESEAKGRAAAFGSSLREALSVAHMTQRELAHAIGAEQPTVSAWINAEAEPRYEVVFSIERALKLAPGTLSRHLGYLPPEAVQSIATVETSIHEDTSLTAAEKEILLGAYRAAIAGKRTRLGRPPKKKR